MQIDRRAFLRAGAGAAVAGIVSARTVGWAYADPKPALTMANFQRNLNTNFRFTVGGNSVVMPLTAVTDTRPAGTTSTKECFSLTFAGPTPRFAQGTYAVDHAAFGKFTMFVVPVGKKPGAQDYEAVFNRITG